MLRITKMTFFIMSFLSIAFISCEDKLEEEIKEDVEEQEELQETDSSVVELPCQFLSFNYKEDERDITVDLEMSGSKITKGSREYSDGSNQYKVEWISDYDGYDLTNYELKVFLNGEPYSESEDEEIYYLVDSKNGILNSIKHIEKYQYEGVYYTYVTENEFIYDGELLTRVISKDGDSSDENSYPDENDITLSSYLEEVYTYNEAKNVIKDETIQLQNKSSKKAPVRSKTHKLLQRIMTNEDINANDSQLYNYQHDDKFNPFSGINTSSLIVMSYSSLFDDSQLLSTNNVVSANSKIVRQGENPFTQEISLTFNNAYNESDLLQSMVRNYISVYTTSDYEDINESQYTYEFYYSCE